MRNIFIQDWKQKAMIKEKEFQERQKVKLILNFTDIDI